MGRKEWGGRGGGGREMGERERRLGRGWEAEEERREREKGERGEEEGWRERDGDGEGRERREMDRTGGDRRGKERGRAGERSGKGIQIRFMLCNLKILIKQEMKVLSRDRIFHHYYYNFDIQPHP